MNDVNQNIIATQQTRNLMLGGGAGSNIGGANSEALEPFYLDGLLPALQKIMNSGCGVVQLAASLFGIKGIENTRPLPPLESIGIFGQLVAPPSSLSLVKDLWGKFPNQFSNLRG